MVIGFIFFFFIISGYSVLIFQNILIEKNSIINLQNNQIAELQKKIIDKENIFEEQRFMLAEANLELLEKHEQYEEQKFMLAEASINLLEKNELLEDQKMKLAEANIMLLEKNEIIQIEREKSEKLLLNILPIRVASDLKERGVTVPEKFENVTVYFSDIVGFTKMSSVLDPKYLIEELNEIFTAMDNIIELNHCERIKTIGDAYLCVCGMPEKNKYHAENVIRSAMQIIKYIDNRNKNFQTQWRLRIGIHTGTVVGGVVGIKKYIYDVFGDTINLASRMESNSEPMKINISEVTYQLVKDKFKFIQREPIEVKGVGQMQMYFVDAQ
ncbi:MAG: adenylate/guanylate cyclase domain-containing protein [Desulfobacterales bacterium]|nr:adenylate/guanylate cyclase domain-containing protein [Desulfobacterales bacterium]